MTAEEVRLWWHLGESFPQKHWRRQAIVEGYIVDFACLRERIIVEADGEQHAGSPADELRDRHLTAAGWTVLRFWNGEINQQIDDVLDTIERHLT